MSEKPLTDVTFSSFDIHPALLDGLESAGFTRCTPIQALTLPEALPGRDIAGQAQTGTGKTLAFLVVAINRLLKRTALAERKPEDPRALILAPTRELAMQIYQDALQLGEALGLKFVLIYGGIEYEKQRQLLREGVDVIIATPGRLVDYVKKQKIISLHACEMCVLDEADRMFELGFIQDLRFLLRKMPLRTQRQTLLFSATLSHRVLELAYEDMNDAKTLVVDSDTVITARVRQCLYFPADEEKLPLLLGLLSRNEGARTMVFVNTKVYVERVAHGLEKAGYRVGVLSGDVPQKRRQSLLERFQSGQLEILVATDVAARGLHIAGVSHVYNYDLPSDPEDYVHRIGRTARLGKEGDAISFACERYAVGLPEIESYIGEKIPALPVTAELMVALPRTKSTLPAMDPSDSVRAIFRQAREHQANTQAARANKPAAKPAVEKVKKAKPKAEVAKKPEVEVLISDKPKRRRRKPRTQANPSVPAPVTKIAEPNPLPVSTAVEGEANKPARKRRRRRHGKPVDAAVSAATSTASTPKAEPIYVPAMSVRPVKTENSGFLTRMGRKFRQMVLGR